MRRLFLATFCLVALLTKTDPHASQSRLGTIESIVERGTYQLDDSSFRNTIDKIKKDGHFYSHQPPLLSTLEAPIYGLLRISGARFHNSGRFVLTYAFTLLTNGVALVLTVLVFADILRMASVPSPYKQWLAMLLPLGTWLLPYGVVTNGHGISGLLVACLIWLLLKVDWEGGSASRMMAIGLDLGLLIAIEVLPVISFAPLTLIYLLSRKDLAARAWLLFAIGLGMPLVAHALINVQITGDVIPAGFHAELFEFDGSGFDESSLTGSLKQTSIAAGVSYASQALFSAKGFFVFAPLCLLGASGALFGWRWWGARAFGVYAVIVGSVAISLTAALLMTNNLGGSAVGFRHAVYLSPAFAVLVLPWIADRASTGSRVAVTAVAAVSAVTLLMFAVKEPWSSLTLTSAAAGSWDQYVPLLARMLHGDLIIP